MVALTFPETQSKIFMFYKPLQNLGLSILGHCEKALHSLNVRKLTISGFQVSIAKTM